MQQVQPQQQGKWQGLLQPLSRVHKEETQHTKKDRKKKEETKKRIVFGFYNQNYVYICSLLFSWNRLLEFRACSCNHTFVHCHPPPPPPPPTTTTTTIIITIVNPHTFFFLTYFGEYSIEEPFTLFIGVALKQIFESNSRKYEASHGKPMFV